MEPAGICPGLEACRWPGLAKWSLPLIAGPRLRCTVRKEGPKQAGTPPAFLSALKLSTIRHNLLNIFITH